MKSLMSLGLAALVLGLLSLSLYAQTTPTPQQDPASQSPPATQTQPMPQDSSAAAQTDQQLQAFTGKIVKSKGNLVLRDEATSTEYKLDSEEQAKQFEGKHVKVSGTLDPSTNTIHVTNIEMVTKD